MVHYVAIFFIIITFILTQEIGFTESHLNCKISTGPNPAQLPFLYVITQTLEMVNVGLELDYLHFMNKSLKLLIALLSYSFLNSKAANGRYSTKQLANK